MVCSGAGKRGVRVLKNDLGPSKSGHGPSKSGVPDTKNHDYRTLDLPKMPQLRCTGSEGMQVLRRGEFHNGMGPDSTFRGVSARTGTRATGREHSVTSTAPTTTTTTTTTTVLGTVLIIIAQYHTQHFSTPPYSFLRFQSQAGGV
jgi:hypothetical protein